MKILDNAIVTMCGECDMVKYDTFTQTNICCHPKMNHKTETVCNCDISKDCPLQDCVVVENLNYKLKIALETCLTIGALNPSDIDKIYILKKK